jgi:uncharacterized membrane protein (UPF0127 family)
MSGNLSTTLIISGVVLAIGVTFLLVFLPMLTKPETDLWLGDGIFKVTVASTQTAREQGLSGKSELDADHALLMVFPSEDQWGIWMKNMNFPIDIVWMNKGKKVVYIQKNAPFDNQTTIYKPEKSALYVVELPAGTTSKKSIMVGETAIFQINSEATN